jgi:hypothetical protein
VQVVAVTLEELVLAHVDDDVEIAGRAAKRSRFAFAGESEALTSGDARGNLHRELAMLLLGAGALAVRARLGDDLAGAAALAAGARDREEPLLVTQLAGAPALRAGRRGSAGSGAVAFAGLAGFVTRDLDMRLDALGRLLEFDFEVVTQIGAALRAGAAAAAAESEDVAEAAEDVFEARELRRVEALRAAADAGVAESIVARPLVGVAEDRVGLGRFLELLSAFLSPWLRSGWNFSASLRYELLISVSVAVGRPRESRNNRACSRCFRHLHQRGPQQPIAELVALRHHADTSPSRAPGTFFIGDRLVEVADRSPRQAPQQ